MTPQQTVFEKTGSTWFVYLVSAVAAISGLLFGYDIAVINGALIHLRVQFSLSEFETELAASSLLFGCIFGASLGGWLSDRFGRRRILSISAVLVAMSAIRSASADNLSQFMLARFIGGLAIGVDSLLAPLYIAEVAPARIRGRLVVLNQMAIVTGILLAYYANLLFSFSALSYGWRWMFAVALVPSVVFLTALYFVPESPRWLVQNGRNDAALDVLTKVNGAEAAGSVLDEIRMAIAEETGSLQELLSPGLRRATVLAISLAILQQITGVNTILFYGSVILQDHVGDSPSRGDVAANVVVGLVNFASTIVALWLIDRIGRRPLLLISSASMCICQFALSGAFLLKPPLGTLVLAAMIFCVASFAIGLGPVTWVLISEIFPNRVRGRAMSVATVVLWIACTALTLTFLTFATALGPSATFALYSAMCAVTFFVVLRLLRETKGRTLEQIEQFWRIR